MLERLKTIIAEISMEMPNGFTFNPFNNTLVKKGYVVACAQTQDCFGKNGLFKVIKYCLKHRDCCIGGWCNEDGIMQYDASKVYTDITEAISSAVKNQQRAIYNLYTGQVIMACDYSMVA